MENTGKKCALITGATSGIGYELAKLFARDGYNLVIVARPGENLENTAVELSSSYKVDVTTVGKDLSEDGAAEQVYQEVQSKGITVNVLVNDAGAGVYGKFWEEDLNRQLKIIHLNAIALTSLTYLFLKEMVARDEGRVLQLASTVSVLPSPLQAVYGATKAYILKFTEAVINELKGTNVTMTALQPGATDTEFFDRAGAGESKIAQDKEAMSDPADVAKDGYEALMSGKDKVVSGFKNKVQIAMANVMPDSLLAENIRKQSEKADK